MKINISIKYLICYCSLIFVISCSKQEVPQKVLDVIEMSGDNKVSFEKVLNKYNRCKKDSLKFKAACFLIANMPGHYGIYHHQKYSSQAIFENIERILLNGFDSIVSNKEDDTDAIKYNEYIKYDIDTITSEFLIRNIENSFNVWNNYTWCRDLTFEDFKKYILPYRVDTEPLMDMREYFQMRFSWLIDSMKLNKDNKKAFELVYNYFYHFGKQDDNGCKNLNNLYDAIRSQRGACYHTTLIKSHIMRSLGIICSFDAIPQWANRSSSHSWNAYVSNNIVPLIIDKNKKLEKLPYISSAKFNINPPGDSLLSNKYIVYKLKKAGKVYRKTFVENKNSIFSLKNEDINIPNEIDDRFTLDVTSEYLNCCDVKICDLKNNVENIAYICQYDGSRIVPVDWANIKYNEVVFKNIGTGILYIAVLYKQGNYHPICSPFILLNNGTIKYIQYKKEKRSITVYRKYPLFGNILNYANELYNGKFQGSNKADFLDKIDLFVNKSTHLTPTEIKIYSQEKFRYLRYLPDTVSFGDIGEISFFYDSMGVDKKVSGKLTYKFSGPLDRHVSEAFDERAETFYKSDEKNTWIGIDLGERNKKKITKIRFNPRTDTNYIIPGNDYELFYWDNKWISLGKKTATKYNLIFNDVPDNALLWLHCHTGGKEERPFTYENNIQVWW